MFSQVWICIGDGRYVPKQFGPRPEGEMPSDTPAVLAQKHVVSDGQFDGDVTDYVWTIGVDMAAPNTNAKPPIDGILTEWRGDHRLGMFK